MQDVFLSELAPPNPHSVLNAVEVVSMARVASLHNQQKYKVVKITFTRCKEQDLIDPSQLLDELLLEFSIRVVVLMFVVIQLDEL